MTVESDKLPDEFEQYALRFAAEEVTRRELAQMDPPPTAEVYRLTYLKNIEAIYREWKESQPKSWVLGPAKT